MSPATALLCVVAAAHDRVLAGALDAALVGERALGAGHGLALAVCARRVAEASLPDAVRGDVADLLEWVEVAPTAVCALAAETARAVLHVATPTRTPPAFVPVGAIARCQREERAGRRGFGQSDALGRAAVWETVARERHAQGDRRGADVARRHAVAELLDADEPAHAPTVVTGTPVLAAA